MNNEGVQPTENKEDHKLGMLDGLRGLMALWVVLGHACILTQVHIWRLDSPTYAVDGFMILSGFLMTYHYILRARKEPWGAASTWKAFWTRRFFRISPLYYLLLIPTFFLMPYETQWRSAIDRMNGVGLRFAGVAPLGWKNVLLHVSYVFGLIPSYSSSLVIPDWSLSLEMQFYFAFPFLILIAARVGWIWFAAGCGLLWEIVRFSGGGVIPPAITIICLATMVCNWNALGEPLLRTAKKESVRFDRMCAVAGFSIDSER